MTEPALIVSQDLAGTFTYAANYRQCLLDAVTDDSLEALTLRLALPD
jgi:hypothetical protein